MTSALIYRPSNHKLTWVAFECAITICLTAIALAENKSKPVLVGSVPVGDDELVDVEVPLSPPEVDDLSPPEPPAIADAEFHDEKVTPSIRPRKKQSITPVRSNPAGLTAGTRGGSAKALALYAPKPNYPYEARRSGTTGSGVAQLTVNSAAGNVMEAHMSQSTGSPILDGATLSAFRQWRFKAGVASNVSVPVTYTLTGVSY